MANPTNADLEDRMVCELIEIARGHCSTFVQRIQAIWKWAEKIPKLKYTGPSLITYFDRLLQRARNYTSPIQTSYLSIYAGRWSYGTDPNTCESVILNGIQTYAYGNNLFGQTLQTNETKMSFMCLNSSVLRIDCQYEVQQRADQCFQSYSEPRFTWFNFTFYLNSSILRYNFDTSLYMNTNG